MTTTDLPIYNEIVEELDFSPEMIAAKCKALAAFEWKAPNRAPLPGVRPVRKRKKAR